MSIETTVDSLTGLPWDQLLTNIAGEVDGVFALIDVIAFLLGLIFLISGINLAAKSANPATRSDHGKLAWLWSLAFSTLFFSLPTTIGSLSVTFFGADSMASDNPFSYMKTVSGTGKLAALIPIDRKSVV